MVKILAIGNSFSHDALKYFHRIAKSAGIETKTVNLFIGGCPLIRHWENIEKDEAAYDYELNGAEGSKKISIKDALLEEKWDYITLQQASNDSGVEETYYPYLTKVSEYAKQLCPGAKQLIHETWSYEIDSDHGAFPVYDCDQLKMYHALKACYQKAADTLHTQIIPCGDVIQHLRTLKPFDYQNGGLSLCRDGYHLSETYGRYAAAATWYECILNADIRQNTFLPDDADEQLIQLIREEVHKIVHGEQ